jgi:broad specificity phosphatase PhoE
LVLVRHAESKGNVLDVNERARLDVSSHDYPLTQRGYEQAQITGAYLRGLYPDGFDVYYASYYERAKMTMELMWPNAKIYEDPRLAEAQRGIYHGLTSDQVRELFPNEIARKEREGLYHYRPWGGENWPDVELRIHSFLGTLARDCEGKSVCIVVHGHWLILFQRLIEHFSIDEALRRYKAAIVPNASVTHYVGYSGRLRLHPHTEKTVVPWEGKL